MDCHDDEIFTDDFASKKLRAVLSGALTGLAPEKKMDVLYFTIFKSCNWDDKKWVPLVHGFAVSIEGSLSASALECLLKCTDPNLQIKEIALPFDSLLIGWPDEKAPIQIIHQSLREILTCAKSSTRRSTAWQST